MARGYDQPGTDGPFLALQAVMSESLEYSKSVLIVEDEQSIRDVLVELFDVEECRHVSVLAPKRSRSPSPKRLMPRTSTKSATPGMTITQGEKNM
mgnify:CR=1 FL=1